MPVIKWPKGRSPLFGGHVQIMIGGSLLHQLRGRKKRQAAAANNKQQD